MVYLIPLLLCRETKATCENISKELCSYFHFQWGCVICSVKHILTQYRKNWVVFVLYKVKSDDPCWISDVAFMHTHCYAYVCYSRKSEKEVSLKYTELEPNVSTLNKINFPKFPISWAFLLPFWKCSKPSCRMWPLSFTSNQ